MDRHEQTEQCDLRAATPPPTGAFARARKELRAAERELAAMRAARADFGAYEDAWRGVLSAIGRCWNAVQHAGRTRAPAAFGAWFGLHAGLRKADPLLRYLHHARNAGEHTTADSAAVQAASITIAYPRGGGVARGLYLDLARHRFYYDGTPGAEITTRDERVALLRVRDRGQWYNPPTQHLGAPLPAGDPVTVAEAGIRYCAVMVDDATRRFS